MNKKKNRLERSSFSDRLPLWITIAFMAVVPLLVRVSKVEYPMNQFSWYTNQTTFYDSYAFFKSHVIIFIGIVALLFLAYRQIKEKVLSFKDPVVISTLVFAAFLLLSDLFSVNVFVANNGYLDRYESTFVWLSYLAVFLLIYSHTWRDETLKWIRRAFVASATLLSVIGIIQYMGYDPVFNSLTRPFVTAFNLLGTDYEAVYSINYQVIVQTLYHYNYVGFLSATTLPVILSFMLYEPKWRFKILYGGLSALVLFNLLGSSARGGLVAIAVALPVFILFNRKHIFKNAKAAVAVVLALVIVAGGFEWYSDGFITMRLKSIFTSVSTQFVLQDLTVDGDAVTAQIDGHSFTMSIDESGAENWVISYTLDGEPIEPAGQNSKHHIYFDSEVLKDVTNYLTAYNSSYLLTFEYKDDPWYFGYDSDGNLSYINLYGKFDSIEKAPSIGFEGKELLGSARGYIWSRTFPLILKSPLVGYGADTFALVFPQSDYVAKYNVYGTSTMVVDKAHNLYLNIAINSGLIALAAYLAYHIILLIRARKRMRPLKFTYADVWQSALLTALIAYFVGAFFNDSTVHVSPVFWAILGLALSRVTKEQSGTEL